MKRLAIVTFLASAALMLPPGAAGQDTLRVVLPTSSSGVRFVPPRPGARRVVIVPSGSIGGGVVPGAGVSIVTPSPAGPTISPADLDRLSARLEARSRDLEAALNRSGRRATAQHQALADSIDSLRLLLQRLEQASRPQDPGPALTVGSGIEPIDSLTARQSFNEVLPGEASEVRADTSQGSGAEPLAIPGPDEPAVEVIERIMLDTGLFRAVQVVFELDSHRLMPHALPVLNSIAEVLSRNPDLSVTVVGHTDNVGSAEYNAGLSRDRAEAVLSYLVSEGVEPARLMAEGRGESEPIADNRFSTGRVLNRRVEFVVR